MNKKTLNIVLSVILGIAAFVTVATVMSLLFGAIIAKDPINITETAKNVEKVLMYVRNSSIAVVCIAIPTVVCWFLTYFSKSKKAFGAISTLLSLMLVAMCLGFIFDLREIVLKFKDDQSTCYTLATSYFPDLLKLVVSFGFACACFAAVTVCAFRTEKTATPPAPSAQPQSTDDQDVVAAPQKGE